jgi:hypothetical protein
MNRGKSLVLLTALMVLGGCATVPPGPSVMVLPAPGKPFEVFQSDDYACRQWALQQAGVPPGEVVQENLVNGAAIGTLLGAGLGAALGAASGNAGAGAAIGAGTGLFVGTAAASEPAYGAGWEVQRRYDIAYQQCMYARGHQIPGQMKSSRRAYRLPPPPPPPDFSQTTPVPPPPGPYPQPPPP